MPEPPFHKGDLLAFIDPCGYFHCFIAQVAPEWDFDCWVYDGVVIHGRVRLATEEDVERWLADLGKQADSANEGLCKAEAVVKMWRGRQW